jgi:rhodanese-related sulfurtransferase
MLVIGSQAFAQDLSAQLLQVTPTVTLAGALIDEAPDLLREQDVLVVDLRTPAEGIETERAALEEAGVAYVNLPISANTFDASKVSEFADLLADHPESSVIVHCASGNRAGLLWGAYQIEQGKPADQALESVRPIATNEFIQSAILDYPSKN